MKKYIALFLALLLLCGCGAKSEPAHTEAVETALPEETAATPFVPELEDGVYSARFDTDSSMFHVNDAYDGRGTLVVQDGAMTIHVTLVSKSILNLYPGLAEDAKKEGAEILEPTVDTVTHSDGFTEKVYGFDIPVPHLNEEFDLALIGKKGTWYDHKVSVSDPQPMGGQLVVPDGEYTCEVLCEGGTGKNTVLNPVSFTFEDGNVKAIITWSSVSIDYMLQDGQKLLPLSNEGGSSFEITVPHFNAPFTVVCDTVAMSTPHEIEYQLTFLPETVTAK